MSAAAQIMAFVIVLACAGPVFAATKPNSSNRIGNGWRTEQACIAAHGGKPWCRMQNCAEVSTGPCLNQPKHAIWFYEPPRQGAAPPPK